MNVLKGLLINDLCNRKNQFCGTIDFIIRFSSNNTSAKITQWSTSVDELIACVNSQFMEIHQNTKFNQENSNCKKKINLETRLLDLDNAKTISMIQLAVLHFHTVSTVSLQQHTKLSSKVLLHYLPNTLM